MLIQHVDALVAAGGRWQRVQQVDAVVDSLKGRHALGWGQGKKETGFGGWGDHA
jgi:hypothetical protein